MATSTLQTDYWSEGTEPIAVLSTDEWSFESSGTPGVLPVYSPSIVSAVVRVQQNIPFPQFVIGGQGGADEDEYGLFKKSTASYGFHIWRTPVYNIGRNFSIEHVSFYMPVDIDTDTTITPVLYFDNERDSAVGTSINDTNYSTGDRFIKLGPKNFSGDVSGKVNFFLEFQFSGTDFTAISPPIFIDVEIHDE